MYVIVSTYLGGKAKYRYEVYEGKLSVVFLQGVFLGLRSEVSEVPSVSCVHVEHVERWFRNPMVMGLRRIWGSSGLFLVSALDVCPCFVNHRILTSDLSSLVV